MTDLTLETLECAIENIVAAGAFPTNYTIPIPDALTYITDIATRQRIQQEGYEARMELIITKKGIRIRRLD